MLLLGWRPGLAAALCVPHTPAFGLWGQYEGRGPQKTRKAHSICKLLFAPIAKSICFYFPHDLYAT